MFVRVSAYAVPLELAETSNSGKVRLGPNNFWLDERDALSVEYESKPLHFVSLPSVRE